MAEFNVYDEKFKQEKIKSFDLLFFKGSDFVSNLITYIQQKHHDDKIFYEDKKKKQILKKWSNDPGEYTHVGMVLKNDILKDDTLDDDDVYVWESTMSGPLNDGVKNVRGHSYFGVQLRSLEELVKIYYNPGNTKISIASLMPYYRNIINENSPRVIDQFIILFNQTTDKVRYDANVYSLFSAIIPCLRGNRRKIIEKFFDTEDWYFCSELAAEAYLTLGILDREIVNPKNVLPMDFLGFDKDDVIPILFQPLEIIIPLF